RGGLGGRPPPPLPTLHLRAFGPVSRVRTDVFWPMQLAELTPAVMEILEYPKRSTSASVIAASGGAASFAAMTFAAWLAAAYGGLALLIHTATVAIAAVRCRPPARPLEPPQDATGVTVVRPVCGIDNF